MEVKPGYKKTEVGVIPEDWDVKQLREFSVIATGNTPPTRDPASYGDEFLFVSPVDLGERKQVTITEKRLSKKGFAISRHFPKDSILFVCIGSTIGKCGIASTELTSNQQINAIFPSPAFRADYLYYFICSIAPRIKALAGEQAVPIVNKTHFSETAVALPLLPEQRAIAEVLGDVDALLGSLEKLIAKKRDLKQAAMQQLLTGKKRLPGFSGEWEVKRFGEITFPRNERIDPRRSGIQEFCVELEHIEAGTGNLVGSNSTGANSSLKSVFRKGDVLFGKLRAYLRKYWLADRAGVCSTEIWVFASGARLIMSAYLFQLVQSDHFIESASTAYGTHMPRSDWNVVKNYELRLPSLPEQTAIAEVLSDMDAELAALEQRLAKTRDLKQGLMQELLTGKTRLV